MSRPYGFLRPSGRALLLAELELLVFTAFPID